MKKKAENESGERTRSKGPKESLESWELDVIKDIAPESQPNIHKPWPDDCEVANHRWQGWQSGSETLSATNGSLFRDFYLAY